MALLLHTLLYVFYAVLFLLLIYRWSFFDIAGVNKKHLAFFFLLKAAAGIGLTLIYTCYYTDLSKADIYRFFNDSKVVSSVLFVHPVAWLKIITGVGTLEPETFNYLHNTQYFTHSAGDIVTNYAFLIRIISILNYFSGYNIYIDTLLLNCITFVALIVLFKALQPYFKEFQQVLYVPLFLLPSFVFWSSGLLKEGLMFVGISLYLSAALNPFILVKQTKWLALDVFVGTIILMVSFAVIWLTKLYVAFVFLLSITAFSLKMSDRAHKSTFGGRFITALVIILTVLGYFSRHSYCEKIVDKRNEFITLAIAEHSGSSLDTALVTADCDHLAGLVPTAMVNAVCRPYVWSGRNAFEMLFAMENLIFMLAICWLLIFYFKKPVGDKLLVALFCLSFAVFNYLVIGITVPVVGAIVHYRVVAAPFLLLAVLLSTDLDKLKRNLPFKF